MRLTVSCDGITLERESSQCPERARNRATDEEVVAEKLKKTGDTPFVFADLVIDLEPGLFIPMTQVNELRRETLGALEETLLAGTAGRRKSLCLSKRRRVLSRRIRRGRPAAVLWWWRRRTVFILHPAGVCG